MLQKIENKGIMMYKFLSICTVIFAVGCSSDPEPQIMPPPPKLRMAPQQSSNPVIYKQDAIKHLRTGEVVKEYTYNRYVDPNDPSVMYDNGSFYRVENSSRWDLTPSRPHVSALTGVGERTFPDEAHYYSIEENAKKYLTRIESEELRKKEETFKKKNDLLKVREDQLNKSVKATEQMLHALKVMQAANKKLENDNKFLKDQVIKFMEKEEARGRRR